jgi:MFS family permease
MTMEAKDKQRIFLSVFFFLSGVCFSTWASRIPTIKEAFNFNEAELGSVLLCMPISSLIGLPISGWLVSRYDSRIPLLVAFIMLSAALAMIGWAPNIYTLVGFVSLFSFSLRILNISMNTQAITLQKMFVRKINGSFHGLWSTGGIVGVGLSTMFVGLHIPMNIHLSIIAGITFCATLYAYPYLIRNDRAPSGNKFKVGKPDPYIVYLGLMVFLAAICEGGMFDWSGVYFKEVVGTEVFTIGYLLFMIFMAMSRFVSDKMMEKFGMYKTYLFSATLIVFGILLAVIFPYFWTSLIGFCLVGYGTAAVVPMTFLLAGESQKYSAGMAISIIATYSIVGMLIGPPMIGYLAHAFSLRIAFLSLATSGFLLIPLCILFFSYRKFGRS